MDNKEFKDAFNEIARRHHFYKAFGGWFRESSECIVALDLQKSNFSNIYYLNIKIYVQGIFGKSYKLNKDLVKKDIGNIFRRHPMDYGDVFDFEVRIDDEKRKERIGSLFKEFLDPFVSDALSKIGIKKLEKQGLLFILPAVKKQFE